MLLFSSFLPGMEVLTVFLSFFSPRFATFDGVLSPFAVSAPQEC